MDLDLTPTKSGDETEIDTPPHTHASSIKNHHLPPPPPAAVAYRECMKNHAAGIGGQAVDGCGEYMPPPSAALKDPTSLTCAACGCHRNFHRREPGSPTAAMTPPFLDFRPPGATPPPRASFQYSPHVLLGIGAEERRHDPATPAAENPLGRKRLRTKFSQEQKEKMHSFAEKLGWRMHKSDEAAVAEFCRGAGVARGVLKVWMHNNKSTLGKKESGSRNLDAGFMSTEKGGNGHSEKEKGDEEEEEEEEDDDNGGRFHGGGVHFHNSNNNGSSSSA